MYVSGHVNRLLIIRKLFAIFVILVMHAGTQLSAFGEEYYVRPDDANYGRGDGLDWTNAFSGLPAPSSQLWDFGQGFIGPGDTVYVAGGEYNKDWIPGIGGGSENTRLIIRRATAQHHGTDVGWDPEFDSQAVLNKVQIIVGRYDYITFDGGVYDGIKVIVENSGSSDIRTIGIELAPSNQNGSDYLILRNIEVEGPGRQKDGETRGIQSCLGDYLLLEDCHIHDIGSALYLGGYQPVVQDCYIHDIDAAGTPNEVHENLLFICGGNNGIFRWNFVQDVTAVGIFTRYGGDNWKIYGNTFIRCAQAVLVDNRGGYNDILVYNNSFISCFMPVRYMEGATGKVINNIFYWVSGSGATEPVFGGSEHDYNWFEGSDSFNELHGVAGGGVYPFVMDSDGNYLPAPTSTTIDRGADLGSDYSIDPIGAVRGSDGLWDIGTFEYENTPDTEPPSIPGKLQAYPLAFDRIYLTWTASTDNRAVREYIVYRQGVELDRIFELEYLDTGLNVLTNYKYHIVAVDFAGNESLPTPEVYAITLAEDNIIPTAPENPRVISLSAYKVELAWDASTDNQVVLSYRVYRDGEPVAITQDLYYVDPGLTPNQAYRYYMTALDAASLESHFSQEILARTLPEPELDDGLVAAYNCDEATGNILRDASKYGNDGTIKIQSETPWKQGFYGWSLELNGKSDLVEVAASPSLNLLNGMTLSAWVYPVAVLSGWQHVIARQRGSLLSFYLAANSQYGTPWSGFSINGVWLSTGGGIKLPPNVWSHVASTYDGQTLHVYVNGVEVSQKSVNEPIETSNDPLFIGGNNLGEYFQGRVDEIRIYNRALPLDEIQTMMMTPIYSVLTFVSQWQYLD